VRKELPRKERKSNTSSRSWESESCWWVPFAHRRGVGGEQARWKLTGKAGLQICEPFWKTKSRVGGAPIGRSTAGCVRWGKQPVM